MSDVAAALRGSIEPARGGGPKLDHGINPLTLILFFGVLAAGLLFVAYSIHADISS
jgi:inorganic phosphate transporter, PiT family